MVKRFAAAITRADKGKYRQLRLLCEQRFKKAKRTKYSGTITKVVGSRYRLKFHDEQHYFSKAEYSTLKKAMDACKQKQEELMEHDSLSAQKVPHWVCPVSTWKVSKASLDVEQVTGMLFRRHTTYRDVIKAVVNRKEYQWSKIRLQLNDKVLALESHIGADVKYFEPIGSGGQVFCVECDPDNLAVLTKNVVRQISGHEGKKMKVGILHAAAYDDSPVAVCRRVDGKSHDRTRVEPCQAHRRSKNESKAAYVVAGRTHLMSDHQRESIFLIGFLIFSIEYGLDAEPSSL